MRIFSSLFTVLTFLAIAACRATAPVTESNPNVLSNLFDQPAFWIVGVPIALLLGVIVVIVRRRIVKQRRKQHALGLRDRRNVMLDDGNYQLTPHQPGHVAPANSTPDGGSTDR